MDFSSILQRSVRVEEEGGGIRKGGEGLGKGGGGCGVASATLWFISSIPLNQKRKSVL